MVRPPLETDPEPSRKRHRSASVLESSSAAASASEAERARAEVAEVFKLWEALHGTLDGRKLKHQPGAQDALQQLKALRRGQAGALALAACWKGFTEKVQVDPLTAMGLLTDILTVTATTAQPELASAALASVVPHLVPLMASSAIRSGPDDSVKEPFKSFTIAVLTLCQRGRAQEDALLDTARQAFCRRPYWFMMALTDALEQQSHPALDGALQFSRTALLDPATDACLFLRVMRQDAEAASQVEMLLRSCITDMRGTPGLKASVHMMTHLESLLSNPRPHSGGVALPGPPPGSATTSEPQIRQAASTATLANERPPASVKVRKPSASPPAGGPGRQSHAKTGSIDRSGEDRRSRSPPPQGGAGRGGSARITPLILPEGKLADDYDGDSMASGVVASCVGAVLLLTGLPSGVETADLTSALHHWSATGLEAPHEQACLVQFETLAAAVCAFQGLSEWLDGAGFGRVRVTFASSTDGDAACLCVPGVASLAQCHGVLKVLEADRVPAPETYALVHSEACAAACILQWSDAQDAEDARHSVRSWVQDVKPLYKEEQRRQQQQEQQREREMESTRQQRQKRRPSPRTEAPHSSRKVAEGDGRGQHQTPAAPDAAAPAAAARFWAGELAKSGVKQTMVHICSANAPCREQSKAWPPGLDMRHRTTLDCVAAMWKAQAGGAQGWCWVAPDQPGDQGFAAFVAYLEQRQRAGIVRADGLDGEQKTLYLVPATAELAEQLAIPFEAGCLLVLAPANGGET